MDDLQVVNITKELAKLHKDQAEKKEVRANLFTLIIYVHDEQRSRYLQDIVQNIIEKYPCRIIFITADAAPESNHLRVRVSSAHNNKGGALIVCDQISIEVGQKYLNRVPYLVLPHLLTDLPVHLLWGQDPTDDCEILPKLEKLADRIIFDAECTMNLKQFTNTILQKKKDLGIELLDINWALSNGWREIILQAFYQPEHLKQLTEAQKINIFYDNQHSDWIHQPEMQSIYLQAWLASRLGWQFKSMTKDGNERRFTYTTDKGDLTIRLTPQETSKLPAGSILSFELYSLSGYHFLLSRDSQQPKICINCSSETMCELPFTLPLNDIKRGFNFMNEIFYSVQSTHYLDVLEFLNRIDWK